MTQTKPLSLQLNQYVPMLRGKRGEYASLSDLSPAVKDAIRPMILIPAIEWNRETETPKRTLSEHLEWHTGYIVSNWGVDAPLFVDVRTVDGELTDEGEEALIAFPRRLAGEGVQVIPTATLIQLNRLLGQFGETVQELGRGFCLILEQNDFMDDEGLQNRLDAILREVGIGPEHVDIVLNFSSFEPDQVGSITMAAIASITIVPYLDVWRSLVVASTAFPKVLSQEVRSNSVGLIPRSEWAVWQSLRRRNLPRKPVFADYLVDNPDATLEFIPGMRIPVVLRYTTDDDWLILKGGTTIQEGNEQFYELCLALIQRPEFKGRDFSWGDNSIYKRARVEDGPGNPEIWRRIAVTHHITQVTHQLSTLGEA